MLPMLPMLQFKSMDKERKDSGNLHNNQHSVFPSDVANVEAQDCRQRIRICSTSAQMKKKGRQQTSTKINFTTINNMLSASFFTPSPPNSYAKEYPQASASVRVDNSCHCHLASLPMKLFQSNGANNSSSSPTQFVQKTLSLKDLSTWILLSQTSPISSINQLIMNWSNGVHCSPPN